MRLTELGYLLVPLGLLLVLLGRSRPLLHLLVFFSPFTASTIVIIEGSRFGMQPSYWIGILFIFLVLVKRIFKPIVLARAQLQFVWLIALFWLYSGVSLVFPFMQEFIGISPELLNTGRPEYQPRPTGFQTYTVTQFAYLTFLLLISLCVMIEVRKFAEIRELTRTLIASAIVTVLWGVGVQYSSFFMEFEYPEWIFNNHPGYSQGFEENLRIIPRLSSVAPEPSMFGYFLLMVAPVLLTLELTQDDVYGRRFQKWVLVLLIVGAIIGTSTTAYVGLVLAVALVPFTVMYAKRHAWVQVGYALLIQLRYLVYIALILLGLFAVARAALPYVDLEDLLAVLGILTVYKVDMGSGMDRFAAFQRGLEILLETGFLGTGWGSNSTFDLFSTLLANVGIIGFGLFSAMIAVPLHHCWVEYRHFRSLPGAALSLGLVHSIII